MLLGTGGLFDTTQRYAWPYAQLEGRSRLKYPGVARWLPGVGVLRAYPRAWLAGDLTAGLVLSALLVPAGLAYAEAAGLPPVAGLYATLVPLIVYAVLGPSRVLVLGPDSSLAPVIGATVLPLAAGDPSRALALAGMLAVFTGLLCGAAGLAGFGFVTDLLAKPVRYGFLNGIAITIVTAQLPKLFGFSVPSGSVPSTARSFVEGVLGGQTNTTALTIGLGCFFLILACKRWAPRVPGALLAVVGSTVVVAALDLGGRAGLLLVGPLPRGLPVLQVPAVSTADLGTLLVGAAGLALVAATDTSMLSRTLAARGAFVVDPDRELVALGAANVAAGLFQGFAVSGSASRTPVAIAAGARSQLTGLVGAATIAVFLVFVPDLVRDLPTAVLGAVVISAALDFAEVGGVVRLYSLQRREFVLSVVCFLGVVVLGVIQGVFLAVGLALLDFIRRAWRPHDAVLGRVDGMKGYHDVSRHPEARRIPGLVLFRWDAPLFFANAEVFRQHVQQAVASSPTPVLWVVIAAEPVTDIDTTAADALQALHGDLDSAGIVLAFAEMKGPVKDQLKRYDLLEHLGAALFFPTVGTAVHGYVAASGIAWVDWQDADDPESL